MADDFEDDSGSFMDRIKESPRTVSALIIILIVAAAIYAFSDDGKQAEKVADQSDQATEATETDENTADDTATGDATTEPGAVAGGTSETPPTDTTMTDASLPEPTRTSEGYQEVAQPGDGVTHLARRAAAQWLNENQAGYAVTNEHRIYIEDYLKDHMDTTGLALGETRTVNYDLIKDAVAAAGQLNEQQLRNLSKYTSALK